ncbi:phosphoribulokinase [Candidatus Enterovibrio altilux]|uniref:Probable phosphoribulokinase n=1 Tax=Candidatus Enterovibrio altilux TaxID=1927128 RepID=A0A291B8D1_9GAMM|nr:phosphoribulokinase [Candidatus Enterovibrio luxaltus]ATF09264.1 Phosphoribulokinase-like protein, function unknown [Candidatus Enterovibrio luxaltus]
MSVKHPIIAVTGSSGAGTTTTSDAFRKLFNMLSIKSAWVEGDSFHRFTRPEMDVEIRKACEQSRYISYFGLQANHLPMLEALFREYAEHGTGKFRRYLHTFDEAAPYNQMPGTFTAWQDLPENTNTMFYEGLHGGIVNGHVNVAQYVDLLIGMAPIVNLEWIQKFVRDTHDRGHSREDVMNSIVQSMADYLHYITPQFSRTHINFQRVPTVDTSNPLNTTTVPSLDESFVIIHFRDVKKVRFPYLLSMIQGSFMSKHNTIVVPGGKMNFAMEIITRPLIQQLIETSKTS